MFYTKTVLFQNIVLNDHQHCALLNEAVFVKGVRKKSNDQETNINRWKHPDHLKVISHVIIYGVAGDCLL